MIKSMMQNPVCGKCGDKGYEETLICCFMCQDAYEHRYCFKKASDIFKKDVKWACEDCLFTVIRKKPSPKKIWNLPARRSERISTKNSPAKKTDISTKKRTKLKNEIGNKAEHLESPNKDDSVECDDDTVIKKADSAPGLVEKLSPRSSRKAKLENRTVDKAKHLESPNTDDSVVCDDDTVIKKADPAHNTVEKLSQQSATKAKLDNRTVDKAKHLESPNTDDSVECDDDTVIKEADSAPSTVEKLSSRSARKAKLKNRRVDKDEHLESPNTDDSVECDDDTVIKKADSAPKTVEKLSPRSAKKTKLRNRSVDKDEHLESPNTNDSVECDDDTVIKEADSAPKTVEKLSPRTAKKAKLGNRSVDKAEQLESPNKDGVVECDKTVLEKNGNTEIEGSKESLSNLKEAKILSGGTLWVDLPVSPQTGGSSPSSGLQQNCNLKAQPVMDSIWKGSFNFSCKKFRKVGSVAAHLSILACPKAQQEASLLTVALKPRMVPRSTVWPKSFQEAEPKDESIALYFFPEKNRDALAFDTLVHDMTSGDLAMICVVKNAELLIFSSIKLPCEHWRIDGKRYLWGVFRAKQTPSSSS